MNLNDEPAASHLPAEPRSFLLRLWRFNPERRAQQASLQDLQTGQQFAFASLEQLFAFLAEQIEGGPPSEQSAG